jgi:sialidase-1
MKRREFLLRASAAAAVFPTRAFALAEPIFEQTDVFVSGEGYPTYRIPAVITTRNSTLLAFSEGRQGEGDHTQNDLVLRRSTDRGRSWGEMRLIARDRPNVLVNPTAVQDLDTGRIWLMYQRYPEGAREAEVVPGYEGDRICRSFVVHSDDDGDSWSEPRETTRSVKRATVATSIASGPGVGIQLRRGPHRGRLVIPFNQGPGGAWKVYAVFSDDHGESWHYGDTAPEASAGNGNEVQMVELGDGTLMLNARSQGGNRCRKVATSRDGGETWSPLVDDPTLIESQCQGTIIRFDDVGGAGGDRLLFANPASRTDRVNGTVRLSEDGGRSWPVSRVVHAGSFAYSCLTVMDDGSIGLLYERDGYGKITFARFNLDWLRGGPGQVTPRG